VSNWVITLSADLVASVTVSRTMAFARAVSSNLVASVTIRYCTVIRVIKRLAISRLPISRLSIWYKRRSCSDDDV